MDPDLSLIQSQDQMPPLYYYLAGTMQSRSGLSLTIILNLLKLIHKNLTTYPVPDQIKFQIWNHLKSGNAAEAKSTLDLAIKEAKNSTLYLESELIKMIKDMRSDPLYKETIVVKLQPSASFNCLLCNEGVFSDQIHMLEECPHTYHRKCLADYLTGCIRRKDKKIICPAKGCGKEIQVHEISVLVEPGLVKNYQDYCFEHGLKSGIYGNIVNCPSCAEVFLSEGNMGNCPRCGVEICGKCLGKKASCQCFPVVYRRQCIRCLSWCEKEPTAFTVCKNCGCRFCFKCYKESSICKCVAD